MSFLSACVRQNVSDGMDPTHDLSCCLPHPPIRTKKSRKRLNPQQKDGLGPCPGYAHTSGSAYLERWLVVSQLNLLPRRRVDGATLLVDYHVLHPATCGSVSNERVTVATKTMNAMSVESVPMCWLHTERVMRCLSMYVNWHCVGSDDAAPTNLHDDATHGTLNAIQASVRTEDEMSERLALEDLLLACSWFPAKQRNIMSSFCGLSDL